MIKNCKTCAHRQGGPVFSTCLLSGFFCSTERQYPTYCGVNFDGWVQRKPIVVRIKEYFVGEAK